MSTKKNLSINSRIIQIINFQGVSKYSFAKKIGVSEQLLSNIANNKSKASVDVVQKILNKYEINSNWLLTGEGEMLKGASTINVDNKKVKKNIKQDLEDLIKRVDDTIYSLKKEVREIKGYKDLKELIEFKKQIQNEIDNI